LRLGEDTTNSSTCRATNDDSASDGWLKKHGSYPRLPCDRLILTLVSSSTAHAQKNDCGIDVTRSPDSKG
jgi:hypothetical protein